MAVDICGDGIPSPLVLDASHACPAVCLPQRSSGAIMPWLLLARREACPAEARMPALSQFSSEAIYGMISL